MKKNIFVVYTILFLASPCLSAETAPPEMTPDQVVRTAIGEIGLLLKTECNVEGADPRQLYAMMDFSEDVMPHIDFRAMAQYALGRYWRVATESQRARFTREFRNQLVRIYSTALTKNRNSQIVYRPYSRQSGDNVAIVKTVVKQTGGAPDVPINYSFRNVHSVWKVYDITIDGLSLVTVYHDVYEETVQKKGIDALIASMVKSNNETPKGKPGSSELKEKTKKSAAP